MKRGTTAEVDEGISLVSWQPRQCHFLVVHAPGAKKKKKKITIHPADSKPPHTLLNGTPTPTLIVFC